MQDASIRKKFSCVLKHFLAKEGWMYIQMSTTFMFKRDIFALFKPLN